MCANCGSHIGYSTDNNKAFHDFCYCPFCGEEIEDKPPVMYWDLPYEEYKQIERWLTI